MKKLMYLVMAALVMAGATSCNKKADSNKPSKLDDSISALYGEGTGKSLLMQDAQPGMNQMGQSKKKLDRAAFLKGLKKGLANDTDAAGQAYAEGFQMGVQLASSLPMMKMQAGVNFNTDIFVQELEKALNSKKTPTDKEMQQLSQDMQRLMQQAQQKYMSSMPKQAGQAVPAGKQGQGNAQKLTPEQAKQLQKAAEAAQKQADAKKAK